MVQVHWCLLLFSSVTPPRVLPLLWGMLGGQRGLVWTQWAARTNGSRWPQLNLRSYKNTLSVSRRGALFLTVIKRFRIFLRCDPFLQEQSFSRWHTEWHLLQMSFLLFLVSNLCSSEWNRREKLIWTFLSLTDKSLDDLVWISFFKVVEQNNVYIYLMSI